MSYAVDTLVHEARQLAETAERVIKDIKECEGRLARQQESLRQVRDARTDILDKLRALGAYDQANGLEDSPPA